MSAIGPKRTSVSAPHMSAFGGKECGRYQLTCRACGRRVVNHECTTPAFVTVIWSLGVRLTMTTGKKDALVARGEPDKGKAA